MSWHDLALLESADAEAWSRLARLSAAGWSMSSVVFLFGHHPATTVSHNVRKPTGVVTGRYGTIGEVFFVEEDLLAAQHRALRHGLQG